MQENGHHALMVHEPGTTPLGLHLREYLKSKRRIDLEAELLLFEASRAQLISEVIRPSLEAGISVVSDRFAASASPIRATEDTSAPRRSGRSTTSPPATSTRT